MIRLLVLLLLIPCCSCAYIQERETPIVKYLQPVEVINPNSGFPGIDCIYVINLDERTEKWNRMEYILQSVGLIPNRFSAINGWKLAHRDMERLSGYYPVRFKKGNMGCLLSHVSVIKDAYERQHDLIWVMEDDIEIIEDVHSLLPLIKELQEIDPEWDVLYTDTNSKDVNGLHIYSVSSDFRPDGNYDSLEHYTQRIPVSSEIERIHQRFGTYSYLVSKKGTKKILDYFSHVYLWTAYDIDLHYIPGIREYSPTRDLISIWCGFEKSDGASPPK